MLLTGAEACGIIGLRTGNGLFGSPKEILVLRQQMLTATTYFLSSKFTEYIVQPVPFGETDVNGDLLQVSVSMVQSSICSSIEGHRDCVGIAVLILKRDKMPNNVDTAEIWDKRKSLTTTQYTFRIRVDGR